MSKPQPKPGEILLGCVHRPNPYKSHLFKIDGDAIRFQRPDGSTGSATWLVLCAECFVAGDPLKAPIGCDYTWEDGDTDIHYKEPS